MEAAVANTLSRGDKVIVVNGGKFGERWIKISKAYGLEVDEIPVDWGKAVDPSIIEEKLENDKSIKAVLLQASDTSTGIMHPTDKIAVKRPEIPFTGADNIEMVHRIHHPHMSP